MRTGAADVCGKATLSAAGVVSAAGLSAPFWQPASSSAAASSPRTDHRNAFGRVDLGRGFAARQGMPFLDTDEAVVARYGPIAGIFSAYGEHYFRDFDHMLTYDAHYVTSADGGEAFDYYPIGADEVKYTAEEYLPSLEDMKIYAEQLGHADRFA